MERCREEMKRRRTFWRKRWRDGEKIGEGRRIGGKIGRKRKIWK